MSRTNVNTSAWGDDFPLALGIAEDLIESRIAVHDRDQFEVKLDYTIDPDAKQSTYRTETYFFLPRSLGVHEKTYSSDQFYSDMQTYIRFKTPQLSIAALLEADNPRSPLTRLLELIPSILRDPKNRSVQHRIHRELRMAACLFRATLRDRVLQLEAQERELAAAHAKGAPLPRWTAEPYRSIHGDVRDFLARFRAMSADIHLPAMPATLKETYDYVDEYLSVITEVILTRLIDLIEGSAAASDDVRQQRLAIAATVSEEQGWRSGKQLQSVVNEQGKNEVYLYRLGVLKRFVMSVLFLDVRSEQKSNRLAEVGAGLAAGTAMAFAVAATIWSQQRYGLNTTPFFVIAVLSYILKDRIKEWSKRTFQRGMTVLLWDQSVRIRDPESDARIGHCKEAVSFMATSDVPHDVVNRRHGPDSSRLERKSKPEVVIKYEKAVRLYGDVIRSHHGRLSDINDIIRFNVSSFLLRMDDPFDEERVYDAETDTVRSVRCSKVYHLNVVFVLKAGGQVASMRRVRVVLDKKGIRRLEEA